MLSPTATERGVRGTTGNGQRGEPREQITPNFSSLHFICSRVCKISRVHRFSVCMKFPEIYGNSAKRKAAQLAHLWGHAGGEGSLALAAFAQLRDMQTAVWRGSQTFFFFFLFFFSARIIITVSRTPFKLMPGELFSIDLFTAIIKCLWIVQRPIFKSLFLLFEGSGKSIKLQKLSYFSSGEEKQSRELLTLKCCCRFPMNEKLLCIIMSPEIDF